MVENPELAVGISTPSVIVVVLTASDFGDRIPISVCRSILQSLVDTFCELALVENPSEYCNNICHTVM